MSNQAVLASMAPGDDAAASWHAGAPRSAVRSGGVGPLAREGTDDSLDEEALDGVEEDLDDDELDDDALDDELDEELDEDEDDEDDDELDEFEDDELDDEDDDDDADEIVLTTDRHDRSFVVADEGG